MDFHRIELASYPHEFVSPNQVFRYYKLNFCLPSLNRLNRQQFMMLLQKHRLTEEQMRCQGFPMWHNDHYATFFNTRKGRRQSPRKWKIILQNFYNNPDPYFYNEDIEYVCGNSSSSSTEDEDSGNASSGMTSSLVQSKKHPAFKRDCTRCHKLFHLDVNTGDYIFEEECHYHWGKVIRNCYSSTWECCGAQEYSRGCTVASQHVWSGTRPGHNGPFNDYVMTTAPYGCQWELNQGIFALDCEMLYTKNGMEVAKVSIVDFCGEVTYSTLVKPSAPIIDYNTRFSGLRHSDLADVTKTLRDVQMEILSFVNSETILIGHSLESDLRALKIVHMKVIDTSIVYPHCLGPPMRRSLKDLARNELNKIIHDGEHSSVEDARTVIDLVIRKMQEDIAFMNKFEIPVQLGVEAKAFDPQSHY